MSNSRGSIYMTFPLIIPLLTLERILSYESKVLSNLHRKKEDLWDLSSKFTNYKQSWHYITIQGCHLAPGRGGGYGNHIVCNTKQETQR